MKDKLCKNYFSGVVVSCEWHNISFPTVLIFHDESKSSRKKMQITTPNLQACTPSHHTPPPQRNAHNTSRAWSVRDAVVHSFKVPCVCIWRVHQNLQGSQGFRHPYLFQAPYHLYNSTVNEQHVYPLQHRWESWREIGNGLQSYDWLFRGRYQ